MINRVILQLMLVVYLGISGVPGVNLYDAEKPLSTDGVEIRVVSRSKRDAMSPLMAEYYNVVMDFGGKLVNARLKRQDVISGLVGQHRVYKRDWATYASDEVDGVFVVHRHEFDHTRLTVEGYMIHDMTPFLLQPRETSDGHVIHKLGHQANRTNYKTLPIARNLKRRRRRETGLLDGRKLYMNTKVIADLPMRDYVRSRFGNAEVDIYIEQYYAMLVTFVDRRFRTLRRYGTYIYFQGLALELIREPIPGVVDSLQVSDDRRATCASRLEQKFISYTQYNEFDQVILLTGYDMVGTLGFMEDGFATTDNGCFKPGARSFVQFTPRVDHFRVAAHAVMKGFGVKDDGEIGDPLSEPCLPTDYFIMAPEVRSPFATATQYQGHWWMYSKCTNNMLRRYLRNLSQDRWPTCLQTMGPHVPVKQNFFGNTMTLDKQCQLFLARMSRAVPTSGNICKKGLRCRYQVRPGDRTNFTEDTFLPLPGTPCGRNKWCDERECVHKNAGK